MIDKTTAKSRFTTDNLHDKQHLNTFKSMTNSTNNYRNMTTTAQSLKNVHSNSIIFGVVVYKVGNWVSKYKRLLQLHYDGTLQTSVLETRAVTNKWLLQSVEIIPSSSFKIILLNNFYFL